MISNNEKKIVNLLASELELSDAESIIFFSIIKNGKMSSEQISHISHLPIKLVKYTIDSLISKGMILNYSNNLYETFHPRFAIINRYKRLCKEKNLKFSKNLKIDNLSAVLEKPFDVARTK
ncbi:MAG: hypothetical protein ACPKQO_06485 [Nitrososphaeraceae archaeon]